MPTLHLINLEASNIGLAEQAAMLAAPEDALVLMNMPRGADVSTAASTISRHPDKRWYLLNSNSLEVSGTTDIDSGDLLQLCATNTPLISWF